MSGKLLFIAAPGEPGGDEIREALRRTAYEVIHQPWPATRIEPGGEMTAVLALIAANRNAALKATLGRRTWKTPLLALVRAGVASAQKDSIAWADDFLMAPWRPDELSVRIERLTRIRDEAEASKNVLIREFAEGQLIGEAPNFRAALDQARQIAFCGATALIRGETGTGKELYARTIHHLGPRRDFPFLPVDCASLPDQLFENELFGHEPGAYTDARNAQPGLISLAEGGTLFLDEIDALSPGSQSKLLRFLQEKTYRPLGSSSWRTADVNILAASNRDLERSMESHQFRRDLYFRLHVLTLHLPPLRERVSDIALLARHFLRGAEAGKTFAPGALGALSVYHWPGNVRELQSAVLRAVLRSKGTEIQAQDLDLPGGDNTPAVLSYREMRKRALENFERQYLERLLHEVDGNITQAAKRAGKERRAMGRLVKKHHLLANKASAAS